MWKTMNEHESACRWIEFNQMNVSICHWMQTGKWIPTRLHNLIDKFCCSHNTHLITWKIDTMKCYHSSLWKKSGVSEGEGFDVLKGEDFLVLWKERAEIAQTNWLRNNVNTALSLLPTPRSHHRLHVRRLINIHINLSCGYCELK